MHLLHYCINEGCCICCIFLKEFLSIISQLTIFQNIQHPLPEFQKWPGIFKLIQPNSQAHPNIAHSNNIKGDLRVYEQANHPDRNWLWGFCHSLHLPNSQMKSWNEQWWKNIFRLYRELNQGSFALESIFY